MVAAVHFFATEADEEALLDHLGEPDTLRLFPWVPMTAQEPPFLPRAERLDREHLGLLNLSLGSVEVALPRTPALDGSTKSAVFNRLNWNRMQPGADEGIVDWNRTPALFWRRGQGGDGILTISEIGSQADSMSAISDEYRKWVNRSMAWVRRRGEKVWEWTLEGGVSRFDVSLPFANTVFALPDAAAFFEAGGQGRSRLHP